MSYQPDPSGRAVRRSSCGRCVAGVAGSNPARGMDICLLCVFLCCQVDVSALVLSLVQRSPTECGVSGCDLDSSTLRWPCLSSWTNEWLRATSDYESVNE